MAGVTATSAGPQVVSVPVGLQQQLLQQQGAQIVSAAAAAAAAAAGQNIAYNVMQPMQAVTVDGQEALFIPAMSLAAGYYYCSKTFCSKNKQQLVIYLLHFQFSVC